MMNSRDDTTGFGFGSSGEKQLFPTVIGPYRVIKSLAAGGFGVVCKAKHMEHGTPAAIKILHAELVANAEAIVRFEREIETLQRLRHPSVIEVLGCGRLDDGRPYFAMELLQGASLKEHLAARGRLSTEEVLGILEPLCSALSLAHEQGIVHRDVKASNVFLCAMGRRVVLLDFGVAKLLDTEEPGLTTSRHMIGTIACMAPEQIVSRPVDARVDVYALGALAYRMLTGEHVFSARSPLAMQQLHLYTAPQAPSARAPVSPALNAPLLRALSKDRDARQPTANAFFRELAAAAGRRVSNDRRRAVAVHVKALADVDRLEAGDEEVLSDLDSIFTVAREALRKAGMKVAMETGTSLLLTRALPDEAERDGVERLRVLDEVAELWRRLEARPSRCPHIELRVRLHVAEATLNADGAVTGGPLVELSAWMPELGAKRPVASAAMLDGLGKSAKPAGKADGIAWHELPG